MADKEEYNPQIVAEPGDVTKLLRELRRGQPDRINYVIEKLYVELRRMAKAQLHAERAGHTLTPTALVHEVYLKLQRENDRDFEDRRHFFAVAAQAMRRILVDHARAKLAARRGGKDPHVPLDEIVIATPASDEQIVTLDLALAELAKLNGRQCRVVELKYFVGLTDEQIAHVLGVTRRTVCRDWRIARAWLMAEVSSAGGAT